MRVGTVIGDVAASRAVVIVVVVCEVVPTVCWDSSTVVGVEPS